MGGHVVSEYMYFWMTCLTGTSVLRDVMLYWACIIGGYVLQECMSSGWHIFRMMGPTGVHVLQEDWSYLRVGLIGGHV